jgi:hypothetical protein
MATTIAVKYGTQHLPWPDQEQLEENKHFMLRELRSRIATYESHYGVTSSRMVAEVRAGRMNETGEVCVWLLDWQLLILLGE